MLLILSIHLVAALMAPSLVRMMGRRAFQVLALAPLSSVAYAAAITSTVYGGEVVESSTAWLPQLGLSLDFRIDMLSWFLLLIVGGVGAAVLLYCAGYFSRTAPHLGRFSGVLTAFAGAMAGLVTTDNTVVLFVFWELTTVFSYLLIGHYTDTKLSRRAAMQAIIVTTAGGLAMLVGIVIFGTSVQDGYRISALIDQAPRGTAVTVAVVLLLVGAISKSALFPLHFWLPAAMAAPTPVSAYLHAAAMVKAGIYLVARFAPGFSDVPAWQAIVVVLGLWTMLLGGWTALHQYDLKLILAYGTVSQLGFMVLLLGIGTRSAALAGLGVVGAHALFKSSLFLTVGSVDVVAGTRDLRRLNGLGRRLPTLALAAGLSTASMVGLPVMAGYVAKEAALESLIHDGVVGGPPWASTAVLIGVVLGSILTFAYGLRFWWGAFGTKRTVNVEIAGADGPETVTVTALAAKSGAADLGALRSVNPAAMFSRGRLIIIIPLVLGLVGLVAGVVPGFVETFLGQYASLYPSGHDGHFTLWGGLTPALGLTVLIILAGSLLFLENRYVTDARRRFRFPIDADLTYRRLMRRLDDFAADATAITQRGSLPFYLSVILVAGVTAIVTVLIRYQLWPQNVRLWDAPAQLVPVAVIAIATVLAARSRRRLKAVLLVGFTGYATAALFVLHGAPDLALTQVLVETVTLVVMVLVLRRLPPYFSNRPLAASRWWRMALAIVVGCVAMAVALVVPGARIHTPVVADAVEQIYTEGGGANIVNVILVDTRAWDTMGEISVLLVAATGVASLVFLRRRNGEILRVSDHAPRTVWAGGPDAGEALRRQNGAKAVSAGSAPSYSWLRGDRTLAPSRRSLVFEVVTRLVFHPMVVFALYLVFSGHNAPGGGFAGGLVVGTALIVRYLAGGRYELGEALPVQAGLLLGAGLVLAVGSGLVALIATGSPLTSEIIHLDLPVFGHVKLVTALFFDLGVFLVVVGLVLDFLRSLGAEIDKQGEVA